MFCVHCNEKIKHFHGKLWHDNGLVFPQYCPTLYDNSGNMLPAKLHEPHKPQDVTKQILEDNGDKQR